MKIYGVARSAEQNIIHERVRSINSVILAAYNERFRFSRIYVCPLPDWTSQLVRSEIEAILCSQSINKTSKMKIAIQFMYPRSRSSVKPEDICPQPLCPLRLPKMA